ncbi:hypothetical protein [Subtercola lobariae]|uniref:Uncharacterized protein n=1 Tax=Subtercola lobariae TaxID=1588641 RepID=A0A917B6F8_9MICO|nr:hypothetical protein [Subtercola lobariae]GGF25817.1 hypothetical protein GCM10011399_19090 [Subtercola lobariae]
MGITVSTVGLGVHGGVRAGRCAPAKEIYLCQSALDDGQTLPFEKDVTAKTGGAFDFSSFLLSAVGDQTTTTITCTITVNGKVISTQTGSGPFANATCSVSGSDLTK